MAVDIFMPSTLYQGTLGLADVAIAQVAWALYGTYHQHAFAFFNANPSNKIEWRCDLPRLNLPLPYETSNFQNLQELCAVQMSGGNQ